MEASYFLARVFGIYLLIIGIAMMFTTRNFRTLVDDMVASPAVMQLSAILTFILGILLIVAHSLWVLDWRLLVTILAWIVFVKGLWRLFCPASVLRVVKAFQAKNLYVLMG